MSWEQEYDRRVASGAPTRFAGDLGNRQVQDDRGNWFHRAPGNLDCPCGRDANGRRCDPWVSAPAQDGEMIDGHYVPFWRLAEFLSEREERLATPDPAAPEHVRPVLYLAPTPEQCGEGARAAS